MKKLLAFIVVSFFISGCAGLTKSKPSLSDSLSSKAIHINVPLIIQQNEKSCGVAALDMLMTYYGYNLNDTLRNQMLKEAEAENGISGEKLKQVLEQAGYRVAVFPGTLDYEVTGLYHHLEQGRPLIVLFGSSNTESAHYSLVTGFDPENNWLILADSKIGDYATKTSDFLEYWKRKNRFTLVAEPTSNLDLRKVKE